MRARGWLVLCAALVPWGALATGCTFESSVEVPGDLSRFDPVAAYPKVAAFAGPGAQLVRIESVRVDERGAQDFTASYFKDFWGGTEYELIRPSTAVADESLPIGVRPPTGGHEGVTVEVLRPHWRTTTSMGGGRSSRSTAKHRGMRLSVRGRGAGQADVVPPPRCSFAALWRVARQQGAPAGAVATITYDRQGYRLRVEHTNVDLRFGLDCRPRAAASATPGPAAAPRPATPPPSPRVTRLRAELRGVALRDVEACISRTRTQGDITVRLAVGASGKVVQATAPTATVPAALQSCVLAAARRWTFSPGEPATFEYTVRTHAR